MVKKDKDCREIFNKYGGIMRTCEMTKEGISYKVLMSLISEGYVEKIKYGYYQWQDENAFSEVFVIARMFPEAIICGSSALAYYGYTDRTPEEWHIAVDNRTARNKFKMDFPRIKPHFISQKRLDIGVSEGIIDGVSVRLYDRERVICDCLRNMAVMDGEIFNTAIQRYVRDEEKKASVIMEYANLLGIEQKARRIIGTWL